MESPRRVFLPLTLVGLGLGGLALLVRDLVTDFPDDVAHATAIEDAGANMVAAPVRTASRIEEREVEPLAAQREELPIGSLSVPEPDALRRLELQGRAVFWGLVLAPEGTPCPAATIFHRGDPVATSDASGAWKIEVEHDASDRFEGGGGTGLRREVVAARKEGVGTASAPLFGPSRRIDLALRDGHRLSGECLDRWTKAPVAGATLDLILEPLVEQRPAIGLMLTTTSDALGRFAFEKLPSGTFELRGHGAGHDSNGFDPLDFNGERDRDYLLLLDPTITVHGWFSPWPPSGGPFASPQVVVKTASPQDHGFDEREFHGAIGDDGRFAIELPQCPRFEASLRAGNGLLWRTRIDLDVAPHDVDFGRIELTETGRLRGRVEIPPPLAEASELHLLVDQEDGARDELVSVLASDGSFEFGPARPGTAGFFLVLPGTGQLSVVTRALREARRFNATRREDEEERQVEPARVVAGAEQVVDELVLDDEDDDWIGVRVMDETEMPLACASVLVRGRVRWWGEYGSGKHARDGLYVVRLSRGWNWQEDPASGSCAIEVRANGFPIHGFEHRLPPVPGFSFCECRLDYGTTTHGVLLDARGQCLVGWHVAFAGRPDDAERPDANALGMPHSQTDCFAATLTDATGEFDCYGFDPSGRVVTIVGPNGESAQLTDSRVEDGTLTLRYLPEPPLGARTKALGR
jgi:hypothetical protein